MKLFKRLKITNKKNSIFRIQQVKNYNLSKGDFHTTIVKLFIHA